jgi:hypothetical protein
VDASAAGKAARCRHCGARFTIPKPGEPEPEVYALDEAAVETGRGPAPGAPEGSAFVRSRGSEPATPAARERRRQQERRKADSEAVARAIRKRVSGFAWPRRLVRGGIALAIALAAIALLAPQGRLFVACVLLILGSTLVLAGYAAGAYGAFREDVLYGLLYLLIPLYTAYYIVTRWDDLWIWIGGSTVGVALVWLGVEMARWGGVAV